MGHPLNGVFQFLSGAAMFGAWAGGVFLFKFWRQTGDRLFLIFAWSFWLMALERAIVGYVSQTVDHDYTDVFVLRLIAFLLILAAIVGKNLSLKKK